MKQITQKFIAPLLLLLHFPALSNPLAQIQNHEITGIRCVAPITNEYAHHVYIHMNSEKNLLALRYNYRTDFAFGPTYLDISNWFENAQGIMNTNASNYLSHEPIKININLTWNQTDLDRWTAKLYVQFTGTSIDQRLQDSEKLWCEVVE